MRLRVGLAAVAVAGRLLGWLLERIGQPRVIGELLAGIAFGLSVAGLGLLPWPVVAAPRSSE